jgi:hydroxymethylbilane synthase
LLAPLHHADTADRVVAERALNKHLNGGCQGADRLLCGA